ncbi:helix-turn-helix domain-containing protein [Micromonospora sp. NPDC002575]|uniref:helix-turn-helix domain-containing protein n=1 Tax=Micromonospora sp. NPDC002575 TaxID=3364222 RepID=UPI0036A69A74
MTTNALPGSIAAIKAMPVRYTGWRAPSHADPSWWLNDQFEGRSLTELLRQHDIGAVFRFLKSRGWSQSAIAAATGTTENQVRAVIRGRQRVTSYEVLERVAEGLSIPRGLMGLAYEL